MYTKVTANFVKNTFLGKNKQVGPNSGQNCATLYLRPAQKKLEDDGGY